MHTEHIRSLGPLEWVMNTPSHHRVHHGRNPRYLDKNYAGIFIIYDRPFATFEPEVEPVDYGITKNLESHNPWHIAWHEWVATARDMARSRSIATALRIALKSPAQQPEPNRLGDGVVAAE